MKNKGFTLIELLAVIVILAIIALIAIPVVLNIIDDAREGSEEQSINMYAKAVENAIADKLLKDPSYKIRMGTYTVSTNGRCLKYGNTDECIIEVDYDNDISGIRAIFITSNGDISFKVTLPNGKTYTYGTITTESCTLADVDNDKIADVGEVVTCGTENFYVINNDDEKTIEMLAMYNLDVGNIYNYDNNTYEGYLDTTTILSSPTYGFQNSKAIGDNFISSTEKYYNYGVLDYSSAESAIKNYEEDLMNLLGTTVTASMPTNTQISGKNNDWCSETDCLSGTPSWLTSTSYYVKDGAYAIDGNNIGNGMVTYDPIDWTGTYTGSGVDESHYGVGARPVITINKLDLDFVNPKDIVCTPVKTATTGNVPQGNYAAGDEYECKVAPGKPAYTFFIIGENSSDSTKVNLIMDSNINILGEAVKDGAVTDYGFVAYSYGDEEGSATNGPDEAIKYLNQATVNWDNITNLNETYDDEDELYEDFALTGKARLIKASEAREICGTSCPAWMKVNLVERDYDATEIGMPGGYWTLDTDALDVGTSSGAIAVDYSGTVDYMVGHDADITSDNWFGVRPVITLNKSQLRK